MEDRKPEVRLSWNEARRLTILEEVRAGRRTQVSAATALQVTDRWIRALLQRLEQGGAGGLAHGNRGRPAANRIPEAMRRRIERLYRDKYEGFNLTHFGEMIQEREHWAPPCREVLRCILREAGSGSDGGKPRPIGSAAPGGITKGSSCNWMRRCTHGWGRISR